MRDKTLITAAGETISYSFLIVATGARVRLLQEVSNEKSVIEFFQRVLLWSVRNFTGLRFG